MTHFAIGSVSGIYAPHYVGENGAGAVFFILRTKTNNALNESQYYIPKDAKGADEQIDLVKRAYEGRHCLHLIVEDTTVEAGNISWSRISEVEAI